jgi:hypothetical protein
MYGEASIEVYEIVDFPPRNKLQKKYADGQMQNGNTKY